MDLDARTNHTLASSLEPPLHSLHPGPYGRPAGKKPFLREEPNPPHPTHPAGGAARAGGGAGCEEHTAPAAGGRGAGGVGTGRARAGALRPRGGGCTSPAIMADARMADARVALISCIVSYIITRPLKGSSAQGVSTPGVKGRHGRAVATASWTQQASMRGTA